MPVLCDPKMVCCRDTLNSPGLAIESYRTTTDLVGPTFHAAHDTPNTSDVSDADVSDARPADTMDADVFEVPSSGAGEIAVDEPSDIPEGLAEQSIEFESRFSDTSTVVVDYFPFGNPGAPIPGVAQGHSSYAQYRATQGDSIWAPFRS
jgi:hypothetical protein